MQSANHSASLRLTGGEAAREARGKCIAAPLNVERRGIYGSSSGEQPSLGRGAKGKTCRHEYRHGAPGDVKFHNMVDTLFSGHHSAKEGIDLPLGQHRKTYPLFLPIHFVPWHPPSFSNCQPCPENKVSTVMSLNTGMRAPGQSDFCDASIAWSRSQTRSSTSSSATERRTMSGVTPQTSMSDSDNC